jgi:membrane-associated phospholipid phosphatase
MEYALRRTRPSGPRNFRRTERYVPLAIATVCVSATLAFVGKSGDARNLMDCLHAMAFVLAAAFVATLAGKVSIHSAAMAGGVIIVGQLFGPVCVTLLPLVVLVGWSRVVLGAHTPQQVLAGVLVGIAGSIQAYGMSP